MSREEVYFFIKNNLINFKGNIKPGFLKTLNNPKYSQNKIFYENLIEQTSILDLNVTFAERCYFIVNDIIEPPTCYVCRGRVKFSSFKIGYNKYCTSSCSAKDENTRIKCKQTCLSKYGVTNPLCAGSIQKNFWKNIKDEQIENRTNKTKIKKLEKYGDENFNNRPKAEQTCLGTYGVSSTNLLESVKQLQHNQRVENNSRTKESLIFPPYERYRKIIARYTDKVYKIYYDRINPLNLIRDYENYQIDHKYSIFDSYNNDIHPLIVCHPCNLQLIATQENRDKNRDSIITIDYLLDCISKEGSDYFNLFLSNNFLFDLFERDHLSKNLKGYLTI